MAEFFVDEPDVSADDLFDYWESNPLHFSDSDIDMEWLPEDWSKRRDLLEAVILTLKDAKPLVDDIAAELLEREYVSDGQMVLLLKQHRGLV